MRGRLAAIVVGLAAGIGFSAQATADDFFKGKSMSMVIGLSPGGDYDLRARLVARHLGRHIPGTPNLVPRNMPGAGGVAAANWLAKVAPRDGTALLIVTQNMPFAQAMRTTGVDFDAKAFNWIGNTTDTPNVITVWSASGAKTVDDARQKTFTIAATGIGTGSYYYPAAANIVAGTKFKLVSGYPGGNEMNLAMERGEVDGRGSNSWAAWKSTKPQWLEQKRIVNLVQIGLKRHPELADIPLLTELTNNALDRQAAALISAETAIARAFATAPSTPADRVTLLRRAFDATMKDPEFLADAKLQDFDISPLTGEESQRIVAEIIDAPADVVARAKELVEPPK